jgi:signal transduction histidine kinase
VPKPNSIAANPARATARPPTWARVAQSLVWAGWLLALAQAAGGVYLAWLNRLTPARLFAEYVVASTAATLAFATVGALVVARRPANVVGWLLCATGLVGGLGAWTGQYARYTFVTMPGALPLGDMAAWVYMSISFGPFVALAAIFLPLLFPNGRLPSPRWRPALWGALLATLLFTVALALAPGPVDASLPEVANPFAPDWAAPVTQLLSPIATALLLASLVAAVAATVVRFRRARGAERYQIKWFAYATAMLAVALVMPALLDPAGFADPINGDTTLSGVLLSAAYPFIPIAVGIAILRHRLYEIDLIINRTLVYGALTACVAGLYIVVVGYLGTLFNARGNLLISLLATGVVAVVFQPLRERLQRGVNRLMFGERDDPYSVIARLGQRLEATLAPDAVLPTIAQTVQDALKLPYVAIALRQGDDLVIVAEQDERETRRQADKEMRNDTAFVSLSPPLLVCLPLVYQGEPLGELRLAPRPGESGFGDADRRLLDDLARHAGIAIHASRMHERALRLAADLQRSRERLVSAREEERRRIRRDLHDGLGPANAGLTFKIDAAHQELRVDVDAAAARLRDLKSNVQEAIADIRRLVYALRPPALDELGLVAALQIHIASLQHADLRVTLDAPADLPALPAAVEVAVYRIATEALTNVVRHAQARTCQLRLILSNGLEIDVTDDGRGLPAERRRGVGLTSMHERAEELGGSCVVEPAAGGGTRVWARLPLT